MKRCLVLVLALAGCSDPEPEAASGYALFGSVARHGGARLADDTPIGVLPVALPAETPALVLRTTVIQLSGDPEVVTYAYGDRGERDTLVIGGDVAADRLAVDGTVQGVNALAAALGATVEPDGDRFVLHADAVWARAAALAEAPGITEVFPVDLGPDGTAVARPRYAPPASPVPIVTEPVRRGPLFPGASAAAELAALEPPRPAPGGSPAAPPPRHRSHASAGAASDLASTTTPAGATGPTPTAPAAPAAPAPATPTPAAPQPSAPSVAASTTPSPCGPDLGCARCEDPVAGVWLARTFRAEHGDWYEFTLTLAHTGRAVTGTIQARFWSGEQTDPRPTLCWDSSQPAVNVVDMAAAGTWSAAGAVDVHATAVARSVAECGSPDGVPTYALDHFTGRLDADGALRVVNNDGVAAFDRKYEFRRVACP